MSSIWAWSRTPADNDDADSSIVWTEGQAPSTVNNSARQMMARVAEHMHDMAPVRTSSGAVNTYTVTGTSAPGAWVDGFRFTFRAHQANTASALINYNGYGLKPLRRRSGTALVPGEIDSGAPLTCAYVADTDEVIIIAGQAPSSGTSADVVARIVRAGAIMAWPSASIPAGWEECDGGALSRSGNSELFSVIGTTYGAGDGVTTFNKPDLRGEVIRGWDHGRGVDPDRASRTDRGDGTTGDNVGTKQGHAMMAHTHSSTGLTATASIDPGHFHSDSTTNANNQPVAGGSAVSVNSGATSGTTSTNGSHSHTITIAGATASSGGSTETRPRNVYMVWCILARPAEASAATLGLAGFSYTFDTGTTDANPGSGKLRYNNATVASVTGIYVSETDGYGANIAAALQVIPTSSYLYIFKVGAPSTYAFFSMGAAATDGGSYDKFLSLTHVGSNGTFSNGDPIAVIPMRAGAQGATGPSGSDGGIRWTFDSSTTMADPGTGDFRLDSATYASVSALAISALTAEATNPDHSDWVTTWDDSTTTTDRGQITLRNALGTARVVLSVNGNITDNGTWLQVPVAHVSSDGTLSGTVFVSFSRSGNAGAGSGDVSAAANFATDNRLLRSDGTLKGAQASAVTVDDSGNMSGVGTIATGNATITGTLGTSGVATIGTTAATAVKVDPSGFVEFPEISAPSTPASGFTRAYAKSDGKIYRKDDAGTETELGGASAGASHGQCRLTKSGSNLLLSRYDGKALIINGTVQDIPSGGVTLAPTSLSINTLYYIYAYMSAGTMTLEASATVPAADSATGVQIKNGDATRTLVGQARTITGPAWADTAAQRFVLSYFNRLPIYAVNAISSNFSTASTSYVEAMPSNRAEFLTWADQMCEVKVATYNFNSTTGYCYTKASFDGGTSAYALTSYGTNGYPCTAVHQELLTVGYHYATGMVKVDTGTGTWQGNTTYSQTTVSAMTMG